MGCIKKKFIEYFGEKQWKQEKLLSLLQKYHLHICNLLGIEMVPVIFEDGLEEDSRLYIGEMYIALSDNVVTLFEAVKCIAHECKHIEQLLRAFNPKTEQEIRWANEFRNAVVISECNDVNELSRYALQEIELDAYAFTQVYMMDEIGVDAKYPNAEYQQLIDLYKDKYYR